ncbi:hypothetical protein CHH28_04345 [Bacterioplanes sanyensis]|uniref:Uncharacterized protein n=1 Tax=Bacterioplanes sanyensis TaxID=1249553 RepID=A0A222FFU9_9GAMM|nr:hypothetical protein [Bacterioplanes sanyensis]ASP37955.1 hypothetical protein CHH28_04345 [Bacterioplanes sanyensis]
MWRMSPADIEKANIVCGLYSGEGYRKRYKGSGDHYHIVDYDKYDFVMGARQRLPERLQRLVGKDVCFIYYDGLFSMSSTPYLFDIEVDGKLFLGRDAAIEEYMSYGEDIRAYVYLYPLGVMLIMQVLCLFCRVRNDDIRS